MSNPPSDSESRPPTPIPKADLEQKLIDQAGAMQNQQTTPPHDESGDNPEGQSSIDNQQTELLGKMFKNLSSSMRAINSRTLPSWDVNSKHSTIKSHIKLAESMAKRYGWTDAELASELFLSLRGDSRSIAETWKNAIQQDFKSLKTELLRYFHTAKPQSQILMEFNNFEWKPNKLSVPQLGAVLRNKIIKMNSVGKPDSEYEWDSVNEAWLRSRMLQAIKQARPDFGNKLELMDIDGKSCSELANFAQQKYEIYRRNEEIRDEQFAALVATEAKDKKSELKPQKQQSNDQRREKNNRQDSHIMNQREQQRPVYNSYDSKINNNHRFPNQRQNYVSVHGDFPYPSYHSGKQRFPSNRYRGPRFYETPDHHEQPHNYYNDSSRFIEQPRNYNQSFQTDQYYDNRNPFENRQHQQNGFRRFPRQYQQTPAPPQGWQDRQHWPQRQNTFSNDPRSYKDYNLVQDRRKYDSRNEFPGFQRDQRKVWNHRTDNPGTVIKRTERVDYLKPSKQNDDSKN